MKKHIILIFILFVTFSFGQKKEIKKATKLFNLVAFTNNVIVFVIR